MGVVLPTVGGLNLAGAPIIAMPGDPTSFSHDSYMTSYIAIMYCTHSCTLEEAFKASRPKILPGLVAILYALGHPKILMNPTLHKHNGCYNPAKGLYAHCRVVNLQLR